MAHDFAKLRATDRPGVHRRGRGAAPRVSESSGSHWSWFFTGLFSGLFAAFVVYLAVLKPTPADLSNAAGNSELAAAPTEEEDRRFDFYDYLPAAEVAVNVEPVDAPPGEIAPATPPATSPDPAMATLAELVGERAPTSATTEPAPVGTAPLEAFAPPAETAPDAAQDSGNLLSSVAPALAAAPREDLSVVVRAPESDDFQYLLQAGSFQNSADAESHRARIILLNMDARVVPGSVSGQTWYRVQVGPFAGRQLAEAARDSLAANAIESIPLRMK